MDIRVWLKNNARSSRLSDRPQLRVEESSPGKKDFLRHLGLVEIPLKVGGIPIKYAGLSHAFNGQDSESSISSVSFARKSSLGNNNSGPTRKTKSSSVGINRSTCETKEESPASSSSACGFQCVDRGICLTYLESPLIFFFNLDNDTESICGLKTPILDSNSSTTAHSPENDRHISTFDKPVLSREGRNSDSFEAMLSCPVSTNSQVEETEPKCDPSVVSSMDINGRNVDEGRYSTYFYLLVFFRKGSEHFVRTRDGQRYL